LCETKRIKVLVIGVDGATFDLILPWTEEGKLPTFKRLINKGIWGVLRSTFPPVSAPAWGSFMTGLNPGKHGIFGFAGYDAKDYPSSTYLSGKLANSSAFSGKTVFDIASSYGIKVGAIKVPITYPPWRVNGIMISGQPTPDERKIFSYPPNLFRSFGKISIYTPDEFQTLDPNKILEQFKFETFTCNNYRHFASRGFLQFFGKSEPIQ